MSFPTPEPGLVICYSFLWSDEAAAGRVEGRKDRPCAVVLALAPDPAVGEGQRVFVVPITHSPPRDPEAAVELPATVKEHLGLDDDASWIVLEELNSFVWPGLDLRPVPGKPGEYAFGHLPPRFFDRVLERLRTLRERRQLHATRR